MSAVHMVVVSEIVLPPSLMAFFWLRSRVDICRVCCNRQLWNFFSWRRNFQKTAHNFMCFFCNYMYFHVILRTFVAKIADVFLAKFVCLKNCVCGFFSDKYQIWLHSRLPVFLLIPEPRLIFFKALHTPFTNHRTVSRSRFYNQGLFK